MKAVTGGQMGKIDKFSIGQIGIPGIVLMENAALKIVKHVEEYFDQNKPVNGGITIVTGKGNNAGDAFSAARHLITYGRRVKIYCVFEQELITGDARLNFDILQRMGADMEFLTAEAQLDGLCTDIRNSGLVIDGIFGTGFRGQVQGHIKKVIELINEYASYIISVDIASGVEAATGKVSDACIRADSTITFELPKIGQLVYPGLGYTGKLFVESIGMPLQAIENAELHTNLIDSSFVKSVIPVRKPEFNKGNCGKVLIVTGSSGMAGSGCISAKAGLRTGSGLVYIAAPLSLINIYQSVVPEAVTVGIEDNAGAISEQGLNSILSILGKCSAAAIGPGLSANSSIFNIISSIAGRIEIPIVLDADALNVIANNTDIFKEFKKDVVITPHPGEMSRLTGLETSYIQNNRIEVAKEFAAKWQVVLVLKGACTIIADKSGEVYINPTGNAGMATAGSGDALSGIIASLIGQGAAALPAAAAGVYLHGLAGDMAAVEKGEHGLNAMDIVENVPYAIKKIKS